MKFGAYYRGKPSDTVTWFQTKRELLAGPYLLGWSYHEGANVYIEDSVAALLMHVADWICRSELEGQEELRIPQMTDDDVARLAERLTDQLIQRLSNHNDPLWALEPTWIGKLRTAREVDAS